MNAIIVFGATGGTGYEVVKQALEKGYLVTVVVRDISAFNLVHKNLTITMGDVLVAATFEEKLLGTRAVISCLGSGRSTKPTKIYSEGIKNIVEAMVKAGTPRLICVSAGGLETNKEMGVFTRLLVKLVLQPILKGPYTDMRLMEKFVTASPVEWTVVRPARLTNKTATGKYRTAVNTPLRKPFSIARADLANFMLTIIDAPETFGSIVNIAY
ncbi:NAD(P)-dependent oxidoreductase [Deminuibacter soli]|uniref:NAD-dependent epimerase/dehydratase family protein n=1 Tax=Deminuibacter soli TaxID=2291815 RepID=A0A3E1NEF5_9BACT|nr:NAD(P)H-binding protein [Deminuibacter soli]RFM26181.1 NAD-dependent epimerase/dehydratase family protein [Deminuibacter soli]